MQRRIFLRNTGIALGAVAAAGLGYRLTRTPSGPYDPFFQTLNETLKDYKRALPCLLLDLDALDRNLAALQTVLPAGAAFRTVAKSLPSPELINYMVQKTGSRRLMSFHQPFLSQLSNKGDANLDILLGKPMPVQTAAYYYDTLHPENGFDPARQVQWLVDTEQRIQEYIALAKGKNLHLRLNVEIDVGLHRGGFDTIEQVANALRLIEQHPEQVSFAGFMGYDAHIAKVPSILLPREKAYHRMRDFYDAGKNLVRSHFPALWREDLTFNGAGSPTLTLHRQYGSPLNDLSAGSFAVKPTDFDIDTLDAFEPAAYIATPVLKKLPGCTLPSLEPVAGLLPLLDPNQAYTYFIYGGSWMADPVQPRGIRGNALFGKSTNQVMLNASAQTPLEVGDFVFFRPHQSEFVLLQFGGILGLRGGKIEKEWSVFNN